MLSDPKFDAFIKSRFGFRIATGVRNSSSSSISGAMDCDIAEKMKTFSLSGGGGFCKEVTADSELLSSSVDSRNSPCGKIMNRSVGLSSANAVQELLECPVCMNLMYPPIYQCSNGHTLCSKCKTRIQNSCPTCRHELGNIRCLALEKIAESMEVPCRYQLFGCQDVFPSYSKHKHESCCKYRPYKCPYAGEDCSHAGDIPYLVLHLKDDHKVDMHDGCSFNHRYVKSNPKEVDNATWMLTVFNCFGHQFCLHFEAFRLGKAPVYMAFIRFMGDEDEANHFGYSLEVGGNGRKLRWEGVPRSIRDSHKRVRESQDGLIVQRNMALFFSGSHSHDLKLKVSGRIWRAR